MLLMMMMKLLRKTGNLDSVNKVCTRAQSLYSKVPKFLDTKKNFAVIYLKFIQRGKTLGYFVKMVQME